MQLAYGYLFDKGKRRKRRKLQKFYNIQNNNAPMYLCDLIPPSIQSTTVYPLRNGSDIIWVKIIFSFRGPIS
jgi:hypothetical protein